MGLIPHRLMRRRRDGYKIRSTIAINWIHPFSEGSSAGGGGQGLSQLGAGQDRDVTNGIRATPVTCSGLGAWSIGLEGYTSEGVSDCLSHRDAA